MKSGFAELRFTFHCGFKTIVYTIDDSRSFEPLGKMAVQWLFAQTTRVLFQDGNYTFSLQQICSLATGLVTFLQRFQDCTGSVLFALGRTMIFWVKAHVETEPQMFAALLEDVWTQFPLKANCASWARNVVHLVRVAAIIANVAPDLFPIGA